MRGRALHLLRSIDVRPFVTLCGRVAAGGPQGKQILTFQAERGGEFEATVVAPAATCRQCLNAQDREMEERLQERARAASRATCLECDDSGWREFASGGIWTGENITTRREVCDCPCGQSVQEELDSAKR